MKYLPLEEFEIHTNLSSDEVFYRLRAATDKERNWWILANKPFWGKVYRSNFRIRRYRGWWRNYPPIVLGEIEPEDLGCRIQIRIRLPWFGYVVDLYIFGFLWLSFLMAHVSLIVQKIQTGIWQIESYGEWLLGFALFIMFFAFMYFIPSGSFMNEALYIKDYLLKLSETTKENIIYRDRELMESQIIKAIPIVSIVVSTGWMIYKFLL